MPARGVLVLVPALVLAAVLTACASKPESATTSPSPPSTTTETPRATASAFVATDPAHYPPTMIADPADAAPTREQRLWALATCAILTESNGGQRDILGGFEPNKQNTAAVRQLLSQWWGIENREQLLETLAWIEAEAWKRIMPAACAKQFTFDSWQDLGSNNAVGRSFWSYAQMKNSGAQCTEIRRKLLVESGSPWVVIPWRPILGAVRRSSSDRRVACVRARSPRRGTAGACGVAPSTAEGFQPTRGAVR